MAMLALSQRSLAHVLPGPRRTRLVGFRGNLVRFFVDPLTRMKELHRNHGEIAALEEGNASYVCAFGPTYNHLLLSNPRLFHGHLTKIPAPPGSALERISRNAFTVNGEDHKRQRRVMQPPFHRRHVDAYRDDIALISARVLDTFRMGAPFDIFDSLQHLTLGVVVKILFGSIPMRATSRRTLSSRSWTASRSCSRRRS